MDSNVNFNTFTPQTGMREKVQKFGRFVSGMVIPNIGAFIAWGLITALFIGPGWMPNEKLALLVGPMLKALLPILIGCLGGRMVGGQRGAVVGGVATFGIMMGAAMSVPLTPDGNLNLWAATPMLLGAMFVGPLGGFLVKKTDQFLQDKVHPGFEMLVNNLADGILGLVLACAGLMTFGPIVAGATAAFESMVKAIVDAGMLPLASVIIEPAKILFMNNAINHGVCTPMGTQQVAEMGKSIFFMLESNPGPGLGILLAYAVFSKGMIKQSAPSAILIHFFGGIHEIYFPYVLMNPIMVLAAIAGGVTGVATFSMTGAGLVGPPAPGSIMMYFIMSPKGGLLPVLFGVVTSCAASFLVASVFIKRSKQFSGAELADAQVAVKDMKNASKGISVQTSVKKIIVACDAGMGSSAMGASILRSRVKGAGLNIEVTHTAIEDIPQDADIVFTHSSLTARAKEVRPNAEHISIDNFIDANQYDQLVSKLLGK